MKSQIDDKAMPFGFFLNFSQKFRAIFRPVLTGSTYCAERDRIADVCLYFEILCDWSWSRDVIDSHDFEN